MKTGSLAMTTAACASGAFIAATLTGSAIAAPAPTLGAGAASSIASAQAGGLARSSEDAHWSYSGATGPEHWGSLSPDWAVCADGTAQSPIDIGHTVAKPLKNLVFRYVPGRATVVDNGHSVEGIPDAFTQINRMKLGSTRYSLLQFHFHAPSEHTINGRTYPLEFHFVHRDKEGNLAVVGVFVEEGRAAGRAWRPFIRHLAGASDEAGNTQIRRLNWPGLLPRQQQTIRYHGSLTTPGCTEGVKWNVMTHAITMSAQQIRQFTDQYDHNARPVQPLHGRELKVDSTPTQ